MGLYDRDYMKADYQGRRRKPERSMVAPLVVGLGIVSLVLFAASRMWSPVISNEEISRTIQHAQLETVEGSPSAQEESMEPLNVNRATWQELDTLPGVTPVSAREIVKMRPFSSVDELLRVKGIKHKTLAKLRPYVYVETNHTPNVSIQE